ncbi:hypothetical protein [Alphaproteobacteria bacterium endosymbiont of Tiliacea citrago]|uniref:hypothetical protein n=1 Tax=Alphaproteobacteria bacterium endosymbiont of Tiliacea citrago TaxID=3077944 RepID=UPI00313C5315
MIKKFFFFFYFFLDSKNNINLKSNLNNKFKSKIINKKIYETQIYAIEFENQIILIGILSDYKNLDKILTAAKAHKKKVLNFLAFKKKHDSKHKMQMIKNSFRKEKINFNNYFFYENENFIWIIGYSKNFYEKEQTLKILKNLKEKGIISDFFCCLKFKKNTNKGFIFRHKI